MEKIEMRARARAAARAAGMFDVEQRLRAETRRDAHPQQPRPAAPAPAPALTAVNEAQARAACAPMGDSNTSSRPPTRRVACARCTSSFPIRDEAALRAAGAVSRAGRRVLLDAAALLPVAVLRLSRLEPDAGAARPSGTGFNPYYDLPAA